MLFTTRSLTKLTSILLLLLFSQACSSCQDEPPTGPAPVSTQDMNQDMSSDMNADSSDMDEDAPVPARIEFNETMVSLEVGEMGSISYELYDEQGEVFTEPVQILWANSDAGIVDVTHLADEKTLQLRSVRTGTVTLTVNDFGNNASAQATVEVTPRVPVRLDVSPQDIALVQRDTVQLYAKVFAKDDFELLDRSVSWASDDDQIATINSSGLVTGQNPGTTTITVSLDDLTETIPVEVTARPADNVDILTNSPELLVNDKTTMNAVVRDDRGGVFNDLEVTWSVQDDTIASIDPATGELTALKAGLTDVIATYEGLSSSTTLTVLNRPITSVDLIPDNDTIAIGDMITMSAMVFTDDGSLHPNQDVEWFLTTGSDVLTHLGDGTFLAENTGTTRVWAASLENPQVLSFESYITVVTVPDHIDLTPQMLTLTEGESSTIQGTVYDANNVQLFRQITWSSSNQSVATIDPNGLILALSAGQTTITAQVDQITSSIQLTVQPKPVDDILITPGGPITLLQGQTQQLQADTLDDQDNILQGRSILWSSSSDTTISIDQTGLITALNQGRATITAQSEGKSAQINVIAPVQFKNVVAGGSHSCAVTLNDELYCFGRNQFNVLGLTGSSDRLVPTLVTQPYIFESISSLTLHQCGISTANKLYCWGANFAGQLGEGSSVGSSSSPIAISPTLDFAQVSTGGAHTCALNTAGQAYCWGNNDYGQLGTGTIDQESTPQVVMGGRTFTSISTGGSHTCALESATQKVYCWGRNDAGQLGINNMSSNVLSPTEIDNNRLYSALSAGPEHTCVIEQGTGTTYCFGGNSDGQLGTDTQGSDSVAHIEVTGFSFEKVFSASIHTCALTTAGELYCWGANNNGQLGNGSTVASVTPVRVGTQTFTHVDTGDIHSCALDDSQFAYCWGSGSNGRLGNNSLQGATTPYPLTIEP